MKAIKVDSIPSEGLWVEFLISRERLEEINAERPLGFVPSGGLEVRGELSRSGQDILFKGKILGALGLSCGRCLDSFLKTLEIPVRSEWRILSSPSKAAGKEGISKIEDLETGVIREGFLDLEERILEEVILVIPILPLCRPDCRGLCPVCGENRNTTPCQCKSGGGASPFSALKDLKVGEK
jgi:uncharacterized protein